MSKIDIAGLKIDAITKKELLDNLLGRMQSGQKTFVSTPYSEFLYRSLQDTSLLEILNKADFSVPDGIGLFWARKYLEIPLTAKSYFGKIAQGLWQIVYSNVAILFNRKWIMSAFPEKIPGSDLIWDIANLAADNNLSIYLLGGFDDTPKIAAEKLSKKIINQKSHASYLSGRGNRSHGSDPHPGLLISGYNNKGSDDKSVIADVAAARPDILMVAYGPIVQEKWIADNMEKLPAKLFIGLGGTFDYIAGKRIAPPKFIRAIGLEWLYRLVTQPHRIKRIWQATFGLMGALWHYKVFMNLPFRKNVAVVILNQKNEVLICERDPKNFYVDIITSAEQLKRRNYWQFPQGGIDGSENIEEAAKREAMEETGISNFQFIRFSEKTHTYMWNNAVRKFSRNKKFQNKGQTQHIVYFKFLGRDDEIKVDHKEFISFKWTTVGALDKIINPERMNLVKIVQEDLKDLA